MEWRGGEGRGRKAGDGSRTVDGRGGGKDKMGVPSQRKILRTPPIINIAIIRLSLINQVSV